MGFIEEVDLDSGVCSTCQKISKTKCTGCKIVYYCNKECQKKHWKTHKFDCQQLPFKIQVSDLLGRHLVAARDLKEGEVIFTEAPIIVGPSTVTQPVCLNCYKLVNGSYRCRKSGWPLCNADCEEAVAHNPEVVIPHQTEGTFEIESYEEPCYLYECVLPIRTLLLQKTSPSKFKKVIAMESHLEERRNTVSWNNCQERVIDVMKKTMGVMVFEALYHQYDFSDELIQRIVGVLETNAIEIRLETSEILALYQMASLLEHNCLPNLKMSFDDDYNITIRAGKDIKSGEHLSIMYTHCLWGTQSRREHLFNTKRFWCQCQRCQDPTEFSTNLSTVLRNGKKLRQKNPLEQDSPWVSDDDSESIPAENIADDMNKIGAELALLQIKGSVEDYEAFIAKYSLVLHGNHFHLITAKHSLLQMLGRTEGYLIQDLPKEQLERKEKLCREVIDVCLKLDPSMVRLQIYASVAMFELHLPLLQYGKRAWESGTIPTDEFRETLREPRQWLLRALDILKDEGQPNLPEGQLRAQVTETLAQLESFMKTVGCEI